MGTVLLVACAVAVATVVVTGLVRLRRREAQEPLGPHRKLHPDHD
ncbi:hypothetical protein [Streptomyces sp. Isolate_219]|nr:hypothetical protein [Streptomyces sp. Isolate_219]